MVRGWGRVVSRDTTERPRGPVLNSLWPNAPSRSRGVLVLPCREMDELEELAESIDKDYASDEIR